MQNHNRSLSQKAKNGRKGQKQENATGYDLNHLVFPLTIACGSEARWKGGGLDRILDNIAAKQHPHMTNFQIALYDV